MKTLLTHASDKRSWARTTRRVHDTGRGSCAYGDLCPNFDFYCCDSARIFLSRTTNATLLVSSILLLRWACRKTCTPRALYCAPF